MPSPEQNRPLPAIRHEIVTMNRIRSLRGGSNHPGCDSTSKGPVIHRKSDHRRAKYRGALSGDFSARDRAGRVPLDQVPATWHKATTGIRRPESPAGALRGAGSFSFCGGLSSRSPATQGRPALEAWRGPGRPVSVRSPWRRRNASRAVVGGRYADRPMSEPDQPLLTRLDVRGRSGLDLPRPERGSTDDVRDAVREIVADVRIRGDAALVDLTRRFDRVELESIRVPTAEVSAALAAQPEELRARSRPPPSRSPGSTRPNGGGGTASLVGGSPSKGGPSRSTGPAATCRAGVRCTRPRS